MPGPALHHMIADRLKARIQSNNGLGESLSATEYAALQALLADPKSEPDTGDPGTTIALQNLTARLATAAFSQAKLNTWSTSAPPSIVR